LKTIYEPLAALLFHARKRKIVELARQLGQRQWLPMETLTAMSEGLAISLLEHAIKEVPYYRERYPGPKARMNGPEFETFWKSLPILQKDDLRRRYDSLIAQKCTHRSHINHSGGSTGKPVTFLSDLTQFSLMEANFRMLFSWVGWKPGEMVLQLWGGTGYDLPVKKLNLLRARLSGSIIFPVYSYGDRTFTQWWEFIRKYKPSVISAYPSVLGDFSNWLFENGYEPKGIKGIFCSAEILYPHMRESIEKTFGRRVFNQYGSRETPCVSCECPEGNMHIFSDLNYVEFIPEGEGSELSRLVVTPLHNFVQPLIRYDLGDLGKPKPDRCPCGRGYPLMELSLGRAGDHLLALDGRKIYPSFFTHLLDGVNLISNFRFRQTKRNIIELDLETEAGTNNEALSKSVAMECEPRIKATMGQDMELRIEIVDKIPRTKAGKYRYVINEMREGK
jgi:phenylacetate-CoA ligase